MIDIGSLRGFDWDSGNVSKVKERVDLDVVEHAFFCDPLFAEDELHSTGDEKRYVMVCLNLLKPVFAVFTLRQQKIRVISARYMHKREVKKYE